MRSRLARLTVIAACLVMLMAASAEAQAPDQPRQRELSSVEYYTRTDLRPIENSLSNIAGVIKRPIDILLGTKDSPSIFVAAYTWCVDSALWCISAVLCAYGQRLGMLWFGVWRPRE
jgi:hypothetical protein